MEAVLTLDELKEKCSYWQEKLGLSHWQVALSIERVQNMPLEKCDGCNEYDLATERAAISIVDPIDYPEMAFKQDMEQTLVHELLHIPMHYIADPERGSLEFIHLEATIDRLARALVGLKRNSVSLTSD